AAFELAPHSAVTSAAIFGPAAADSPGRDNTFGMGGFGAGGGRSGKAGKPLGRRNGQSKGKMEEYKTTLSLAIHKKEAVDEPTDFIDASAFHWAAPPNANSNGNESFWFDLTAKPRTLERLSEDRDGTVTAINGRGEYQVVNGLSVAALEELAKEGLQLL